MARHKSKTKSNRDKLTKRLRYTNDAEVQIPLQQRDELFDRFFPQGPPGPRPIKRSYDFGKSPFATPRDAARPVPRTMPPSMTSTHPNRRGSILGTIRYVNRSNALSSQPRQRQSRAHDNRIERDYDSDDDSDDDDNEIKDDSDSDSDSGYQNPHYRYRPRSPSPPPRKRVMYDNITATTLTTKTAKYPPPLLSLPAELLLQILHHLDLTSLRRLRGTSKDARAIITNYGPYSVLRALTCNDVLLWRSLELWACHCHSWAVRDPDKFPRWEPYTAAELVGLRSLWTGMGTVEWDSDEGFGNRAERARRGGRECIKEIYDTAELEDRECAMRAGFETLLKGEWCFPTRCWGDWCARPCGEHGFIKPRGEKEGVLFFASRLVAYVEWERSVAGGCSEWHRRVVGGSRARWIHEGGESKEYQLVEST